MSVEDVLLTALIWSAPFGVIVLVLLILFFMDQ